MAKKVPLLVWEGPIKGFAVNYINVQFWRLQDEYESVDEALQEAYVIFHRIRMRYRGVVDSQAHFMALFKTALCNHVTNVARKSINSRTIRYESSLALNEDTDTLPEVVTYDEKSFEDILEGAHDAEVRAVLSLFIQSPSDLMQRMSESWGMRGKMKMHGDQFLMEALDVTPGVSKRTRNYLRGLRDGS